MKTLYRNKRLGTKVCRVEKDDQFYVVKSFPKQLVHLYSNEIYINKQLSHKHIILFHYAIVSNNRVTLFFDYAVNGDLFDLIYNRSKLVQDVSLILLKVIRPLLSAVHYLHINDIVHMDIKPENVLFGQGYHLYLADFGLSIPLNNMIEARQSTMIGTKAYVSPEQILEHVVDYKKVDIWCLGLLIYEVFHRQVPYKLQTCKTKQELLVSFNAVSLKSTRNKNIDFLIYRMLQFDPIDRIDIQEARALITGAA
jgi:serine/threonine protein kinase